MIYEGCASLCKIKKFLLQKFLAFFIGEIEILFVMREEQIFVDNIRRKKIFLSFYECRYIQNTNNIISFHVLMRKEHKIKLIVFKI